MHMRVNGNQDVHIKIQLKRLFIWNRMQPVKELAQNCIKKIGRLTKLDMHVAIGGIALPNDSSIALHEKFSFKKTAHFKEVGYKFNKWVDVGYWQLILN